MNRSIVLFLTVCLASASLLVVETANVSAYLKPSVPQFTVRIESNAYYVPATYRIDPYTGENVTASFGYWAENESLVVTIKNLPFIPYNDTDGNYISLTYNVRVKGHYEPEWTNLGHFDSSGSEYLVKSYAFGRAAYLAVLSNVPVGGKMDIQVDARVGYYTVNMTECKEYFYGETSGWSEPYTITYGESQTPSPQITPSQPGETPSPAGWIRQIGLTGLIILLIVAFVLGAGLALLIHLVKKK